MTRTFPGYILLATLALGACAVEVDSPESRRDEPVAVLVEAVTGEATVTPSGVVASTATRPNDVDADGPGGNRSALAAVLDSANTHTGSWAAKATLSSSATWKTQPLRHGGVREPDLCCERLGQRNGKLRLDIVDSGWTSNLASVSITATGTRQQVPVPNFSSGNNTTIHFSLHDGVGGTAGTVYLDDVFLGLPGGANLLTNAGFENGTSDWIPDGPFSIVQNPAGPTCPNGSPPGKTGCADMLDAMASELMLLRRRALDPATPAASRPTGAQLKELALSARAESPADAPA